MDAGNAAAVAGMGGIPLFDQRGTPHDRILNGRIDIGAVEVPPPAPPLPGDYNLNSVVDMADYILWRNTTGTSVPQYSGADGDGNGIVETGDYTVWREHFGDVLMMAAGSSVAETETPPAPGATANVLAVSAVVAGLPTPHRRTTEGLQFAWETCGPHCVGVRSTLAEQQWQPAVLDLLLALDPAYIFDAVEYDSLPSRLSDAAADDAVAIDAALDESSGAIARVPLALPVPDGHSIP